MTSACWRAASARALSQCSSCRPAAARSRLAASRRNFSSGEGCDVTGEAGSGGRFGEGSCERAAEIKKREQSDATAAARLNKRQVFIESWPQKTLAADADGAEAQDDVAARGGPAKTHHRAETREKQHLVKLVPQVSAVGTGENLVAGHLPVRVNRNVDEKPVRKRKLNFMLFGRPGLRVVRQSNQLGGAQNIERHVIRDGAHRNSRNHQLQNERKNRDRRKNSASRGNGKRPQNVVEQNLGAVTQFAETASPILGLLRLRRGYFNTHSQIGWRNISRHAREQHGKLAKGFEFGAAKRAAVQVLTNLDALRRGSRASDS